MYYRSAKLPEGITVSEIMSLFTTCFDTSGITKGRQESYPFWAMIYTIEGKVMFRIGERNIAVRSGEMIFYPAGVPHCILETEGKNWHVSFLTFKSDSFLMNALAYRVFPVDNTLMRKLKELFDFGAPLFYNLPEKEEGTVGMYCNGDELSLMYLKNRLEGILTSIYLSCHRKKDFAKEDSVFLSAVELMKERMGEELTLADIAKSLGVSVSTLKNAFFRETGGGVTRYYIDMRLARSVEMLAESNMRVGEIAEKLGFSSQFYYTEQFKKKYGMPPRDYRRKLKNGWSELM